MENNITFGKGSVLIPWDFDPEDTKSWEQARFHLQNNGEVHRFGGSELSKVMDNNPYEGALYLFNVKLGRTTPRPVSLRMINGNYVESTILKYLEHYEAEDGSSENTAGNVVNENKVRDIAKAHFFLENPNYPCMLISLDGVLEKGQVSLHDSSVKLDFTTFVEVKNVSWSSFNAWGGVIPTYYMTQLQGSMAVANIPYCYFAVFVDNNDLHVWKVDREDAWSVALDDATRDLSVRIAKAKVILEEIGRADNMSLQEELYAKLYELEPTAGAEKYTSDLVKSLYDNDLADDSAQESIIGGEEEYELAESYLARTAEIKELTKEKEICKNRLLQAMHGHKVMETGDLKISNGYRFGVKRVKGG